ncbi:MAG: hypothetical protein EOM25_14520 [Deltaproteobacteria bacterium]|nr:hypothetical protein [Deltaproteobacteria bacterium]
MLKTLTEMLVKESLDSWEAGLQNCPGPISAEQAKRALQPILERTISRLEAEVFVTAVTAYMEGLNNETMSVRSCDVTALINKAMTGEE